MLALFQLPVVDGWSDTFFVLQIDHLEPFHPRPQRLFSQPSISPIVSTARLFFPFAFFNLKRGMLCWRFALLSTQQRSSHVITVHMRRTFSSTKFLTGRLSARHGFMLLGVLLILLCGVTAVQGEVVISEDFNTGTAGEWPDGWYVDNGVWEHGVPTVGPANCAGGEDSVADDFCAGTVLDGNYPAGITSRLESATLELPTVTGNEEVHLRFWQWFSYTHYSSGTVQISVLEDPANQTWSEWRNTTPVWSQSAVDLTAYAGQTVRIGFLHAITSSYVSSGWYIDALEIVRKIPEFTGDFEDGWVDWWASRGVWEVGTPAAGPGSCYEGSRCAGTVLDGNYPGYTISRLVSAMKRYNCASGNGFPMDLTAVERYRSLYSRTR
jgi:hypothetical protein